MTPRDGRARECSSGPGRPVEDRLVSLLIDGAAAHRSSCRCTCSTIRSSADAASSRRLSAASTCVHPRSPNESAQRRRSVARPSCSTGVAELRSAPAVFTYAHAKYMIIDDTVGVIMSMNFNSTAARWTARAQLRLRRSRSRRRRRSRSASSRSDWALARRATAAATPANLACTRPHRVAETTRAQRVLDLAQRRAAPALDIEALYVVDNSAVRSAGRTQAAETRRRASCASSPRRPG